MKNVKKIRLVAPYEHTSKRISLNLNELKYREMSKR